MSAMSVGPSIEDARRRVIVSFGASLNISPTIRIPYDFSLFTVQWKLSLINDFGRVVRIFYSVARAPNSKDTV